MSDCCRWLGYSLVKFAIELRCELHSIDIFFNKKNETVVNLWIPNLKNLYMDTMTQKRWLSYWFVNYSVPSHYLSESVHGILLSWSQCHGNWKWSTQFKCWCQAKMDDILQKFQASKFQIEYTCPLGKWILKITCPNVTFTSLKYVKPVQLMWKLEICNRLLDKSCRHSTCPTVIFTRLRRSDEWNFEPSICSQGSNQQEANIDSDNVLVPSRWQAIMWTYDGLVYWCILSISLDKLIWIL